MQVLLWDLEASSEVSLPVVKRCSTGFSGLGLFKSAVAGEDWALQSGWCLSVTDMLPIATEAWYTWSFCMRCWSKNCCCKNWKHNAELTFYYNLKNANIDNSMKNKLLNQLNRKKVLSLGTHKVKKTKKRPFPSFFHYKTPIFQSCFSSHTWHSITSELSPWSWNNLNYWYSHFI